MLYAQRHHLAGGLTGETFTDTEKKTKREDDQILPIFRLGLPYWQPSNFADRICRILSCHVLQKSLYQGCIHFDWFSPMLL